MRDKFPIVTGTARLQHTVKIGQDRAREEREAWVRIFCASISADELDAKSLLTHAVYADGGLECYRKRFPVGGAE